MRAEYSEKEGRNHCSELLMLGSEPRGRAGRPCHYVWACGSAAAPGCGTQLRMAQGPDHPPLQSHQGMHSFRWAGKQEVTSGLCPSPEPSQGTCLVHAESCRPGFPTAFPYTTSHRPSTLCAPRPTLVSAPSYVVRMLRLWGLRVASACLSVPGTKLSSPERFVK